MKTLTINCCLVVLILVLLIITVLGCYTNWTFQNPVSEPFGQCLNKFGPLCKIFDNVGMECALMPSIFNSLGGSCGKEIMTQEMWNIVDPYLLLSDPLYDGLEASGKPIVGDDSRNDWLSGVMLKPDTSDSVIISFINASKNSSGYNKLIIVGIMRTNEFITVKFHRFWDTQYEVESDSPIPDGTSITLWKFEDNDAYNDLMPLTCAHPPTHPPTAAPTVPIHDVELVTCRPLKFRVDNPTNESGIVLITNQKHFNFNVNWDKSYDYLGFDMLITMDPVFIINTATNLFKVTITEPDTWFGGDDTWTLSFNVGEDVNEGFLKFNDNDSSPVVIFESKIPLVVDGVYHISVHVGSKGECYLGITEYDNLIDKNIIAARKKYISGGCMGKSYLKDLRYFHNGVTFGSENGVINIKEVDLCGVHEI